jgi:hypothetical protein
VARKAALTRKVALSIAITPLGESTAISPPAIAGPTSQPKFSERPRRALASCRRPSGATCGIKPPAAGRKNASAAP